MLRNFRTFLYMLFPVFLVGCGGGSSTLTKPPSPTNVVFLSMSTANDRLNQFYLGTESITMINANGQSVPVLNVPQTPLALPAILDIEWMHVNGNPEPLFVASVPQGIYTAVQVSASYGSFSCLGLDSQGNSIVNFWLLSSQTPTATIDFSQPVTISENSMGIILNLLVSQSATFPDCNVSSLQQASLTPNYSATAINIAPTPTSITNGILKGMEGVVASVDNQVGSMLVSSVEGWGDTLYGYHSDPPNGPSWTLLTDSNTAFQGIGGLSQLAAGMAVDIDATIQQNGTLHADRVTVYDTQSANTSSWNGPVVWNHNTPIQGVTGGNTSVDVFGREEIAGPIEGSDAIAFNYGPSTFNISKQLSNLSNLPFPARFNSANMIAGQNVSITMHDAQFPPASILPTISAMTLLPQTLNGTVSAIGSSGNFTTYTITLASYDLFPALAVQPGQTTLLTNPSQVVVYADNNTQMLNTNPIAVGSVVRFYGLVFNDNGTLRMDCAEVLDGVPE